MGNRQTITYSYSCSEKKEGETSIRRNLQAREAIRERPSDDIHTMQDAWLSNLKKNANQMFLFSKNNSTNVYEGKTYAEVHDLSRAIGSAVIQHNLASLGNEDARFPNLKMVGIFAKNCEEWTILDVSNILYGHVMIPLYDTLGPENITYCLRHSGITTCFATGPSITQLAKTANIGNLKTIVVLGSELNPAD